MAQERGTYTAKQVAEILQVSYQTVMKWARNGDIPCWKLNGFLWRFSAEQLNDWCAGRRRTDGREV